MYIFPLFRENYYFPPTLTNFPPVLHKFTCFLHTLRVFRFPPTFTMMHLCITQCTYWMPLQQRQSKDKQNTVDDYKKVIRNVRRQNGKFFLKRVIRKCSAPKLGAKSPPML